MILIFIWYLYDYTELLLYNLYCITWIPRFLDIKREGALEKKSKYQFLNNLKRKVISCTLWDIQNNFQICLNDYKMSHGPNGYESGQEIIKKNFFKFLFDLLVSTFVNLIWNK